MDFAVEVKQLRSSGLDLDYYLVPWDSEILASPVAEISHIELKDAEQAGTSLAEFEDWCVANDIRLCHCRILHHQTRESLLLQERGFRFIELNYRPELRNLQSKSFATDSIEIAEANPADHDLLVEMAQQVFQHGRFHQDPRLGSDLGNRRYGVWMHNSFSHPGQFIYKCMLNGEIVAFFVVEYPAEGLSHWALIGLAPGCSGQGLGTRAWQSMMRFQKHNGIQVITTSISSHNTAVLNLYVKLGFRFPEPMTSYHWRR